MILDGKVPAGELSEKWTNYKSTMPLVAPNNKRRLGDHRGRHRIGRCSSSCQSG